MSLQVWLPLIKDTKNQGLCGDNIITSGIVFSGGGKLGAKYLSAGTITIPASVCKTFFNKNNMSFAFWLYPIGTSSSGTIVGKSAMSAGDNRMYTIFQYPTPNDLHLSWQDETSSSTFLGGAWTGFFPADTWTHCCVTYDGEKASIYKNGTLFTTMSGVSNRGNFEYDFPIIGNSIRKLNDVRIYDHALSPMEVKEIAKGLVLHYPLNRNGWGQENIAKNSDKIYNWGFNSIGQLSNTLINDNGVAKFTLVKNTSTGQAGNYWTYNRYTDSLSNFVEGEIYTLSLFIKSDTQHTIALAGLYESQTRVATCGDNVVTSEWKNFWVTFTWTSTAKMTICLYFQNVEANSTINYWVKNLKLEKGDKITPWCPNSSDELATTMGMNDGIEYDTSGFGNNGTRTGTFSWASDTPKYAVSQQFNGSAYTVLPITCSVSSDAISVAVWGYESNWNTSTAERLVGAATSSSGWCIGDYGSENTLFAFYANGSYNAATGFKSLSSGWHHFVITFDGLNLIYYVDGQEYNKKTFNSKQSVTGNYNINIGRHYGGGYSFKGRMSDFRIYATALSASDVLSLYQNSAYIDSSGNVYGAVHEEV